MRDDALYPYIVQLYSTHDLYKLCTKSKSTYHNIIIFPMQPPTVQKSGERASKQGYIPIMSTCQTWWSKQPQHKNDQLHNPPELPRTMSLDWYKIKGCMRTWIIRLIQVVLLLVLPIFLYYTLPAVIFYASKFPNSPKEFSKGLLQKLELASWTTVLLKLMHGSGIIDNLLCAFVHKKKTTTKKQVSLRIASGARCIYTKGKKPLYTEHEEFSICISSTTVHAGSYIWSPCLVWSLIYCSATTHSFSGTLHLVVKYW